VKFDEYKIFEGLTPEASGRARNSILGGGGLQYFFKYKGSTNFGLLLVRIYLSSDHCVYPQNHTPDPLTTKFSAMYRRETNEGE